MQTEESRFHSSRACSEQHYRAEDVAGKYIAVTVCHGLPRFRAGFMLYCWVIHLRCHNELGSTRARADSIPLLRAVERATGCISSLCD